MIPPNSGSQRNNPKMWRWFWKLFSVEMAAVRVQHSTGLLAIVVSSGNGGAIEVS